MSSICAFRYATQRPLQRAEALANTAKAGARDNDKNPPSGSCPTRSGCSKKASGPSSLNTSPRPKTPIFSQLTTPRAERRERFVTHDRVLAHERQVPLATTERDAVRAEVRRLTSTADEHGLLHAVRQKRLERHGAAVLRLAVEVDETTPVDAERRARALRRIVEGLSRKQDALSPLWPDDGLEELGRQRLERLAVRGVTRPRDAANREAADEAPLVMKKLRQGELGRGVATTATGRAVE